MRTIKVKPLTAENFKHYGTFASMLNPEGPSLGDFYNDQVEFPVSGNLPIAFSPLISRKPEKMIITTVEYHTAAALASQLTPPRFPRAAKPLSAMPAPAAG